MPIEIKNRRRHVLRTPEQQYDIYTQHKKSYGKTFAIAFDAMYKTGIFLIGWTENPDGERGYTRVYFEVFQSGIAEDQKETIRDFMREYFFDEGSQLMYHKLNSSVITCRFKSSSTK
jgi:hypothetical protein